MGGKVNNEIAVVIFTYFIQFLLNKSNKSIFS